MIVFTFHSAPIPIAIAVGYRSYPELRVHIGGLLHWQLQATNIEL